MINILLRVQVNNLTKNDFFQVISQPAKRKQDMSSTVLQQEQNSIEESKKKNCLMLKVIIV